MTTKETNPKDLVGTRKVPLSAIPFQVLWGVGLAMMEGGLKYGRHNYRGTQVSAQVYFDACVSRHLGPWWEGEDIDPDSGDAQLHHLDKAIACLFILRDAMMTGQLIDDRPPSVMTPGKLKELNEKAAALTDKLGYIQPTHYTINSIKVRVNGTPQGVVTYG